MHQSPWCDLPGCGARLLLAGLPLFLSAEYLVGLAIGLLVKSPMKPERLLTENHNNVQLTAISEIRFLIVEGERCSSDNDKTDTIPCFQPATKKSRLLHSQKSLSIVLMKVVFIILGI